MKFCIVLAVLALLGQPLFSAPKSLMNIKIDPATRTIIVNNQSSGGSVYIIDFGDGRKERSTTVVDYVHTYALPGVYQVCMITQSISSTINVLLADTLCKTVEIPETSCTALFDIQTDGMTLQLSDRSVGDYKKTYWYLEGVTKRVNKSAVSYEAKRPGYYSVRLRIEGKNCNSEKDTIVLLRPDTQACAANFSFVQSHGFTVAFQNLSEGNWTNLQWNFGDGNYSTESDPLHTYAHPGNFKVQLSLFDSLRNLISEHKKFVKVANEALQYLPDFEAESYPDSNRVQFINQSLATTTCTYLWSFGDGNLSTDSSPVHLYSVAGQYTVCLTQIAGNNRYTLCKPITVGMGEPPLSFSYLITGQRKVVFTANWASVPDIVEWNFGDDSTSDKLIPVHRFRNDSVYLVSLKARWDSRSQEVYQIVNLSANPSKLTARFVTLNSQLKAGSKRIRYRGALSGDVSRVRFEWHFGDGHKDTLNLEPDYSYATDSVYTVCLKVFNDLTNDSELYCQQVRVGNVAIGYPTRTASMLVVPKNGYVKLKCNFHAPDRVRIELLDMAGRKVSNIYAGDVPEGRQTYEFNCKKGVYLIRLLGNRHAATQKVIVF